MGHLLNRCTDRRGYRGKGRRDPRSQGASELEVEAGVSRARSGRFTATAATWPRDTWLHLGSAQEQEQEWVVLEELGAFTFRFILCVRVFAYIYVHHM